jgi:hypothetical protein
VGANAKSFGSPGANDGSLFFFHCVEAVRVSAATSSAVIVTASISSLY